MLGLNFQFIIVVFGASKTITVPNGSISGNNKVWRKFTFSPISTSKIRVLTNAAADGYSRLTEIEAYAPADAGTSGGTSGGTHWLITDQLGTPRMVLDQSGALDKITRHDYLPFGEELFAPTAGRSAAQGYTSDGVRQRFTEKERDVETGLDYFGARYYSSIQGRFSSSDEFFGGPDELYTFVEDASFNPTFYTDVTNPQSLNKYQYSYNNPLRYIDPDGHDPQDPCSCRMTPAQAEQAGKAVTDFLDAVADATGITTAAEAIREYGPKIIKEALNKGRSAAQQDLEDLSGRAQRNSRTQSQSNTEGGHGSQDYPNEPGGGFTNVPDPKNTGLGKKFTQKQKREILEANKAKNGGELRSDKSGQSLNPATRTQRGQPRDPNEAQVDHLRARAKGGTNRSSNAQVLGGRENRKKGTKDP